jgi:hypothetical protein
LRRFVHEESDRYRRCRFYRKRFCVEAQPGRNRRYPDYTSRGGEDTEKGLIKKIFTFYRVYEYDESDELLKPDGSRWKNEDEIWNCRAGFTESLRIEKPVNRIVKNT